MNRVIVCDTGPLLHLNEANALHLLKPAGKILIPPSVVLELKHNAPHWKIPNWMNVKRLNPGANRQAINWVHSGTIDSGEAKSIGLALQMKSDWFLTDDTEARQFAETLGMEVHGSVGVCFGQYQLVTLRIKGWQTNYWTGLPIHHYGFPSGSSKKQQKPLMSCYKNENGLHISTL